MSIDDTAWSPAFEVSRISIGTRHALCPYGSARLSTESGSTLCANCFSEPNFIATEGVNAGPCSCASRLGPIPVEASFDHGCWSARCSSCKRTWRGESRLGDHGRWETTRPTSMPKHPPGERAPRWFFDDELVVTAGSSGSVSFRSSSGTFLTVSVIVPNRSPLEGQLEPFELGFCPEDRRDQIEKILPDVETRTRLRSVIEQSIRDRLNGAARGEETLLRARELVNLATRVFNLLR